MGKSRQQCVGLPKHLGTLGILLLQGVGYRDMHRGSHIFPGNLSRNGKPGVRVFLLSAFSIFRKIRESYIFIPFS